MIFDTKIIHFKTSKVGGWFARAWLYWWSSVNALFLYPNPKSSFLLLCMTDLLGYTYDCQRISWPQGSGYLLLKTGVRRRASSQELLGQPKVCSICRVKRQKNWKFHELILKGTSFGVKGLKLTYILKNLLLYFGASFRQTKWIAMITKEVSTKNCKFHDPRGKNFSSRAWLYKS